MRTRLLAPCIAAALILVVGVLADVNALTHEVRLDPRDPYLRVESKRLVGDKGELMFEVGLSTDARHCGDLWVFDHAELEIIENRFGDAQFIGLPDPGCIDCAPGTVRWFHEPTGYLTFEVHVYRRMLHQPCPTGAPQPSLLQGAPRVQDD